MEYRKANCTLCNKELIIKVAKGENAPDSCMCKACSHVKKTQPKQQVNLAHAQDHNFRAVDRAIKNR